MYIVPAYALYIIAYIDARDKEPFYAVNKAILFEEHLRSVLRVDGHTILYFSPLIKAL